MGRDGVFSELSALVSVEASASLAAPKGLSVNDQVGRVILSWSAVDDDALIGYDVYRSSRSDTGFERLQGTEGNSFTTGRTSYTDSSLAAGELAYYRVQAVGRDGVFSELSAFASGEANSDETAPGVPRSLSAVADQGASRITVRWSAPLADTDGGDLTGIAGYVLLRAEGAGGSPLPVDTLAADVREYLDSGLKALTGYSYALLAFDEAGNQGPQAATAPTTTAGVERPTSVRASAGIGRIVLSWNPVDDSELAGYDVFRATRSDGDYTRLTGSEGGDLTTGRTSYVDSNLAGGSLFFYKVQAVAGNGLRSEMSVFTGAEAMSDESAPGAPRNVAAVAAEDNPDEITLGWSAPLTDAEGGDLTGLSGFVIFRTEGTTEAFTPVDTVAAGVRRYVDGGLKALTAYTYAVVAFDADGNESPQTRSNVTQTAGLPVPAGLQATDEVGRILLSWFAVDNSDLAGYDVYRSTSSDGEFVALAGADGSSFTTGRTTFVDSNLAGGTLLFYKVQAVGSNGLRSELSSFTSGEAQGDESSPGQPRNVSAVADEDDSGRISVGWSAPVTDSDGGALTGLAGYVLLRAEGTDGAFLLVDSLSAETREFADTGLRALTDYRYALSAYDDSGNEGQQVLSNLTRTSGLPTPAGLQAVDGIERILLSWFAVDNSDLAGYDVYRSTSSDGEFVALAGADGSSFTTGRTTFVDSNLAGGTLLFYKVQAVGSNGLRSELSSFTSGEAQGDESSPGQPRNVSAVADEDDSGRISVGWSAPVTDSDGGALTGLAGYVLLRAEGTDGAFLLVDSLSAETREFADTGLRALTDYRYALSAYDDSGNEGQQVLSNLTRTSGLPTPAGLQAVDGIERILLSWSAVDNSDLAGYDLFRASTSNGDFQRLTGSEGTSFTTGRTTFIDSGLTAGDLFFYKVQAIGDNGLTSGLSGFAGGQSLADESAPGRALNVSALASQTDLDQVTVRWAAPATDADGSDLSGIAGFRILRAEAGASLATVSTVNADDRQFDDSGLRSLTSYTYAIIVFDAAGNEGQLSATSTTTTIGVSAPSSLSALEGTERITLSWASVDEDDLVGYNVYRSTRPDANFVQLSGDGGTDYTTGRTSYVDSTVGAGVLAYYRVSTVTSGFESERSEFVSAIAEADSIASLDGVTASGGITRITVSWTSADADDLEGYNVYRATQSDGTYSRLTGIEGTDHTTGQSSYVDSGLVGGQVFFYRVSVVTTAGESGVSDFAGATVQSDTRPPAAPTFIEGEADADDPEVLTLTWTAPTTDSNGDELTGVASYTIYRSDASAGPFTKVGTSTTPQFQDSGLEAKTTYYYEIEALDTEGNIGPRSSVTAAATGGVDVPSNVRIVSTTPSSAGDPPVVTISWDASSGAIVRYEVQRTQVANSTTDSDYTDITPNSLQTSRTDNTVTRGQTYYYRVRAVDIDSRNSDWTDPLQIDVSN